MPTRKHLYKAKRKDNGEWVKGFFSMMTKGAYLNPIENGCYITTFEKLKNGEIILSKIFEVIPETVCECTGLTDKNGDEIFEGDIVDCKIVGIREEITHRGFVEYIEDCFAINIKGIVPAQQIISFSIKNGNIEVIGNIYDNPELLEVKV